MSGNRREFEFTLPIGYVDGAGKLQRRAVLRKMRGHEEALLYDPSLSGARLVSELIGSCLGRLGDLEAVGAELAAQLYTADRNYLLLELRRITLGERLRTSYQCPRCGAEVALEDDLGAIPVRRLEDGQSLTDIEVELEDGYEDRDGTRHSAVTLTLPRGVDEEFVAPLAETDPMKAHDALLLRCLKRFGTLPKATLEAYGVKILRDLTLGDRRRLQRALNDGAPGADFQRSMRCGQCATAFIAMLDVNDFFLP